jgi:hypothetical protein
MASYFNYEDLRRGENDLIFGWLGFSSRRYFAGAERADTGDADSNAG